MSTMTYAARDSVTLLRRNLKHLVRYPSLTLTIIGMPVVFLLLFVYVFGGTMGAGLPGGAASADPRADYLLYITPAILVMTVVVGRQQHRDPGREGRDRGDHRPVPDDADRAVRAADRACAGRDGADGVRRRSWSSAIALALGYRGDASVGRMGRRRRHARC